MQETESVEDAANRLATLPHHAGTRNQKFAPGQTATRSRLAPAFAR